MLQLLDFMLILLIVIYYYRITILIANITNNPVKSLDILFYDIITHFIHICIHFFHSVASFWFVSNSVETLKFN